MSSTYEALENNQVKITLNIPPKQFEEAINTVYNMEKGRINIQGFRKGKAPRKIIEMHYGESYFHIDAINHLLPNIYDNAVEELNLDVVSRPDFDVEDISKENGATVTAMVYQKPPVVITKEDYTGVAFTKIPAIDLSEEEIMQEIKREQDLNTRLIPVEREVQANDITTIDFEGFLNGEAFPGGKGEDYKLTIGSGTFIPGFEDQLIGKNIGEDITVDVTFPEEYSVPELKGQPAQFKVLIKEIFEKEIPELDDEFAQDVSEFETFVEYEQSIRENLQERLNKRHENEKNNVILRELAKKIEINIPVSMVENEVDIMMQNFEQNLNMQGQSLEMYSSITGQSYEDMRSDAFPSAETNVKIGLILDKISELEGFDATEEEIKAEIASIAETYSMDPEKYYENMPKNMRQGLESDVKRQKANRFVVENSIELQE